MQINWSPSAPRQDAAEPGQRRRHRKKSKLAPCNNAQKKIQIKENALVSTNRNKPGYFRLCSASTIFAYAKYLFFSSTSRDRQLSPRRLLISLFESNGNCWAIFFLFSFAYNMKAFAGLGTLTVSVWICPRNIQIETSLHHRQLAIIRCSFEIRFERKLKKILREMKHFKSIRRIGGAFLCLFSLFRKIRVEIDSWKLFVDVFFVVY